MTCLCSQKDSEFKGGFCYIQAVEGAVLFSTESIKHFSSVRQVRTVIFVIVIVSLRVILVYNCASKKHLLQPNVSCGLVL